MPNERAILCGGVSEAKLPCSGKEPLRLRLWGPHGNVTLCIDDIQKHMLRAVPSPFVDLIEIATYVYCADQAVTRGGDGVKDYGENWRRRLFFRIPVRNPDLWGSPELTELLCNTLGFLSEDEYAFEFVKLDDAPPFQQYLHLAEEDRDREGPEEVALFSGGLDSLGGAIQEAVLDKRRVALVTHRSTQKLARRHRDLKNLLAKQAQHAPIHLPVSINKAKALGREYTQRSRSFLYAALGATIAQMFGLSRIRFYENGVVSFNLPPSAQVVGARATRTTHPQTLNGFAAILSAVADKRFTVENPFLWHTKTDVLALIKNAGCSDLVRYATSCTHTWEMTRLHTHCGACSQCIDRRFAVLSAGLEDADPAEAYKIDLLTGERDEGEPRTMLAAYVETANQLVRMDALGFFSEYGEASRVLRHLNGSPDTTALRLFELHQKHARQVKSVITAAISKHSEAILERSLPASCLLRLVCDAGASTSAAMATPPTPKVIEEKIGDYVFRKKGQVWQVRFAGGEDFILLPSKGAAYLHILLSNPGKTFYVAELVTTVAKAPLRYALGDAGELSDREAITAYRARYTELAEDLVDAEKNDDLGRQDRIREEMEALQEHVKRVLGLGGRLRRASDDRKRVRDAFRAAIRRVVKDISDFDAHFSEHLRPPQIRCGLAPYYDPKETIIWET